MPYRLKALTPYCPNAFLYFFPDQFCTEPQPVISEFYMCQGYNPEMGVHKHGDRETPYISLLDFAGQVTFRFFYFSPELNSLNLPDDPGFKRYSTCNFPVLQEFLSMPGLQVGSENQRILLFQVNIETGRAPGLVTDRGGYGQHMMLPEELYYPRVNHCPSTGKFLPQSRPGRGSFPRLC